MSFAQTYREERLINRRSRARKARIAGRIIGFGLTACLVMALRTDPQLRGLVEDAALAVIGATDVRQANATDATSGAIPAAIKSLGYVPDSEEARALEELGINEAAQQRPPTAAQMPQSRVKVNRPGSG